MKKIFIPTPLADTISLPADITHHIIRVFRHDLRKPVLVSGTDNRSGYYMISGESDGVAQATLVEYIEQNKKTCRVVLVQSLLKGDKMELVLQKATELNVDTIYLVSTANNVVKYDEKKLQAKVQRWEKILQEASQQCGRPHLPTLVVDQSLANVLSIEDSALLLVAYENESGRTIKHALQEYQKRDDTTVLICIGPEGGFQQKEIDMLVEHGVESITLGSTILRAETAAISAVAMINYEMELQI